MTSQSKNSPLPARAEAIVDKNLEKNQGKRPGKTLSEVQTLLRKISEARQSDVKIEAACDLAMSRMHAAILKYKEQAKRYRLVYFHELGRLLKSDALKKKQKNQLLDGVFLLACILEEEHETDVWDDLCLYSGKPREYFLDQESNDDDEDFLEFEEAISDFEKQLHAQGFRLPTEDDFDRENTRDGDKSIGSTIGDSDSDEPGPRPSRKKARPKKAAEQADKTEPQASLLGDIRTLYLMLARALHPDKESDENIRHEKTAWMQKVTAAYAAKNLGDLLDILARNPLNAMAPYLETTPEATLRGFAKRLRRELQGLTRQAQNVFRNYPPEIKSMVSRGEFSEPGYKAWEAGLNREMQIYKHRAQTYKGIESAKELLAASYHHLWEELL